MTSSSFRSRSIGVLAAAAVAATFGTQSAQAAPADTTGYTTATYLQNTLGFAAAEVDPALEPVTYDRFQWLLQQPGQFAILIGDPATDPSFKDRARDVEAAADARGVKTVYWFNPNLSGGAKVGDVVEPNLDIRDADNISVLNAAASKAKYRDAWSVLVAHYLGNGRKVTHSALNSGSASVTVTSDDTVANDTGGTEVGKPAGGALYDYRAGAVPGDLKDTVFLVYDKDRKAGAAAQKIAAWTDLGEQASSSAAQDAVTAAIASVGASAIDETTEYAWWKDQSNAKQEVAASERPHQGAGTKLFPDGNDGAAAKNWRVHQITYPELVDLLKLGADTKNAVILFGGVWCPNTRAVLPEINEYAQEHDVTVYNFDTVLDGGLVAGTTAGTNPLQIRNGFSSGANPSFLYGDLVSTYLKNIKTQYTPSQSNAITYHPGGDTSKPQASFRRLQVPFLVGYQRDGDGNGARRQWLIDNGNDSYTEYMTNRYLSDPQPNQINLSATSDLPAAAPIWTTLNQQISTVTWDTAPASLARDRGTFADSDQYLVAADRAALTYTPASGGTAASVTSAFVPTTGAGYATATPIGPEALASSRSAIGPSAPATLAAAKTALIAAETADPKDDALIGNLRTIVGAFDTADKRKGTINTRWGTPTEPGSILGGLAAIHAADVFFTGLPRVAGPTPTDPDPTPVTPGPTPVTPAPVPTTPVVTPTPTKPVVTAPTTPLAKVSKITGGVVKAPTARKAGTYKVAITVRKGASAATGKVTVKLKKGAITKTLTGRLSRGVVTVKVPKLAKGTWKVTITWPGDTRYAKTSASGKAIKVRK